MKSPLPSSVEELYERARVHGLEVQGDDPSRWPEWDELPAYRRDAMRDLYEQVRRGVRQ